MATSVTQFGITWTFDTNYTVGQYANGDYYVVAPSGLTIVDIDPASEIVASRENCDVNGTGLGTYSTNSTINGSMVNPITSNGKHGFDSSCTGYQLSYNAGLPAGSTLDAGNPLILAAGSSLVTSTSFALAGRRPTNTYVAVLTVVSSAPAANSFRPPYMGTDKSGTWNVSDINYTPLGSHASVAGEPSSLTASENAFEKPWIEVLTGSPGRYIHPSGNMPDYGADMSQLVNTAAIMLTTSAYAATRETLAIRLIQYGIDVYGAATTGANWENNGGHNLGRKLALLYAGTLLGDSAMLAYANAATHFIFQEDQQTFVVDAAQLLVVPYTGDGRARLPYVESTVTYSGTDITWPTAHGFSTNQPMRFTTTGTLPSPLAVDTDYKIVGVPTATTFQVAIAGSTPLTLTGGTGTLTATMIGVPDWGEKHDTQKTRDGSNWGTYYRDINYTKTMATAIAVKLLDGGEAAWNWSPFFDYHLRIRKIPSSPPWGTWVENLWLAYGSVDTSVTVPLSPTDLAVSAPGPARLSFSWTDNSDNEASFTLYRATSSGGTYTAIATIAADSTSYILENCPTNRTYYYKLIASNINGNSASYTNIVSASATEPYPLMRHGGSTVGIFGGSAF